MDADANADLDLGVDVDVGESYLGVNNGREAFWGIW